VRFFHEKASIGYAHITADRGAGCILALFNPALAAPRAAPFRTCGNVRRPHTSGAMKCALEVN